MSIDYLVSLMSGGGWTLAYLLIIIKGIRDKSYGMPLVPLALNVAWEFIFSFVYPTFHTSSHAYFNIIWLLLDLWIIYLFFKNGKSYLQKEYKTNTKEFYLLSISAFTLSFLVMIWAAPFFESAIFFNHDFVHTTTFIAYFQNIIISVCFVLMYYQRRSSEGQSFLIGLFKFIGTPLAGIYYLQTHKEPFVWALFSVIFVFDIWYMILIYKQLLLEKKNPWTVY